MVAILLPRNERRAPWRARKSHHGPDTGQRGGGGIRNPRKRIPPAAGGEITVDGYLRGDAVASVGLLASRCGDKQHRARLRLRDDPVLQLRDATAGDAEFLLDMLVEACN